MKKLEEEQKQSAKDNKDETPDQRQQREERERDQREKDLDARDQRERERQERYQQKRAELEETQPERRKAALKKLEEEQKQSAKDNKDAPPAERQQREKDKRAQLEKDLDARDQREWERHELEKKEWAGQEEKHAEHRKAQRKELEKNQQQSAKDKKDETPDERKQREERERDLDEKRLQEREARENKRLDYEQEQREALAEKQEARRQDEQEKLDTKLKTEAEKNPREPAEDRANREAAERKQWEQDIQNREKDEKAQLERKLDNERAELEKQSESADEDSVEGSDEKPDASSSADDALQKSASDRTDTKDGRQARRKRQSPDSGEPVMEMAGPERAKPRKDAGSTLERLKEDEPLSKGEGSDSPKPPNRPAPKETQPTAGGKGVFGEPTGGVFGKPSGGVFGKPSGGVFGHPVGGVFDSTSRETKPSAEKHTHNPDMRETHSGQPEAQSDFADGSQDQTPVSDAHAEPNESGDPIQPHGDSPTTSALSEEGKPESNPPDQKPAAESSYFPSASEEGKAKSQHLESHIHNSPADVLKLTEDQIQKHCSENMEMLRPSPEGKVNLNNFLKVIAKDKTLPNNLRILGRILGTKYKEKVSKLSACVAIDDGPRGTYNAITKGITVNILQPKEKVAETTLHEVWHGLTVEMANDYKSGQLDKLTPRQIEALDDLEKIRQAAINRVGPVKAEQINGLKNIEEFIAEGHTNREFRKLLAGISTKGLDLHRPAGTEKKLHGNNLWSRYKQELKKLYGFGDPGNTKEEDSALSVFVDRSMDLLGDRPAEARERRAELPEKLDATNYPENPKETFKLLNLARPVLKRKGYKSPNSQSELSELCEQPIPKHETCFITVTAYDPSDFVDRDPSKGLKKNFTKGITADGNMKLGRNASIGNVYKTRTWMAPLSDVYPADMDAKTYSELLGMQPFDENKVYVLQAVDIRKIDHNKTIIPTYDELKKFCLDCKVGRVGWSSEHPRLTLEEYRHLVRATGLSFNDLKKRTGNKDEYNKLVENGKFAKDAVSEADYKRLVAEADVLSKDEYERAVWEVMTPNYAVKYKQAIAELCKRHPKDKWGTVLFDEANIQDFIESGFFESRQERIAFFVRHQMARDFGASYQFTGKGLTAVNPTLAKSMREQTETPPDKCVYGSREVLLLTTEPLEGKVYESMRNNGAITFEIIWNPI